MAISDGYGAGAGARGSIGDQGGARRQHLDGEVPAEGVYRHLLRTCPGGRFGLFHRREECQSCFSGCYKLKMQSPLQGYNGRAEAWGRAERDGEGEAGSGCMQAGLLVSGMSHVGHSRDTPCPSTPLILRLHALLSL